jgi:hypothetical protein
VRGVAKAYKHENLTDLTLRITSDADILVVGLGLGLMPSGSASAVASKCLSAKSVCAALIKVGGQDRAGRFRVQCYCHATYLGCEFPTSLMTTVVLSKCAVISSVPPSASI